MPNPFTLKDSEKYSGEKLNDEQKKLWTITANNALILTNGNAAVAVETANKRIKQTQ